MKNARKWVALAACAAGLMLLGGCGTKNVDLIDLVEVEFTGLDTQGRATATIQAGAIEELATAVLGEMPDDLQDRLAYLEEASRLSNVIEGVELSQKEGLQNGDKVTATLLYDEEEAEEQGFRLKETEKEFTVSGLREAEPLDLFQGIDIQLSGASPRGRVTLSRSEDAHDFLQKVSYQAEPYENLKNGDEVTITATYNKNRAEQAGYLVESDTYTFTVEGLDEMLTDISQLDADTAAAIHQDATDLLQARLAANDYDMMKDVNGGWVSFFSRDLEYGDPSFATAYLLTSKGAEFGANYENILVLVYTAHVSFDGGPDYDGPGYFPVAYYDIVVGQDGCQVDLSQHRVAGSSSSLEGVYDYWGTQNLDRYTVRKLTAAQLGME